MRTEMLSRGIYSIPLAARLLGVAEQNLRVWIRGSHGMTSEPIILSEFTPIEKKYAISFVNLIEARFIAAFAREGVSVVAIRHMAQEAKRILNHPHPFATETVFKTDGKTIFMQASDKVNDQKLYDLRKKNFAMLDVLKREFKDDVIYSGSGNAETWYPRKLRSPNIVLNPKISFGSPSINKSGIPTEAIMDAFVAERRDANVTAWWFDIPVAHVRQAVKFENEIRKTLH